MACASGPAVRVLASRVLPYALPLKPGWRNRRGALDCRSGALLRLDTDDGRYGWGDCAPLADGGSVPRLTAWSGRLHGLGLEAARDLLARSGLDPAACCAVDCALADLAAQQAGLPLARWLDAGASLAVRCNAILGPLDEGAAERALAAAQAGFGVLKLKVGLDGVGNEIARLVELARALPPGTSLRLDANGAWSVLQARQFLAGAVGLPVEMIEEPLAVPDLGMLADLQRGTEIALALDESLPCLGMAVVMAARPVRRLVLKPMLLGGVSPALQWARQARAAGIECIATTTLDSAAGTLAAAHLAAALDNGLHHGLATSSWLLRDVGPAPAVSGGIMRLDHGPGLGFRPYS